jgi:SAM-dependent methyltransferase
MTADAPRRVSELDVRKLAEIRENVARFIERCGARYDRAGFLLLDVAPQDHEGAPPYFCASTIETLDINPASGADYIADICATNESMQSDRFDGIVCTEVLEHTLNPFAAVAELYRLLKPGGVVFVTTPFNFRIHGPLPDCWRFTEHGLRALFVEFEVIELDALDDPDRFLMPTHYTLVGRKPGQP